MGLHLSGFGRSASRRSLPRRCGWLTARAAVLRPKSSTPRRARSRAESLRGRAQPVQGHRGPPPGFVLRAARAFPHRRDVLPRGRVRQAVKEFEAFLAFYPQHQIADLVQYRLAVSYYDQMKAGRAGPGAYREGAGAVQEARQGLPAESLRVGRAGEDRHLRGRLAQKELFIAHYYYDQQDNTAAARQRLEGILKNYQHTLVIPETLFLLAEVNFREARTAEPWRCSAGWPPSMPTRSGKARRPAPSVSR